MPSYFSFAGLTLSNGGWEHTKMRKRLRDLEGKDYINKGWRITGRDTVLWNLDQSVGFFFRALSNVSLSAEAE